MKPLTLFDLLRCKPCLLLFLSILISLNSFAQNFSGLQNKSLNKLDDLGAALASLIGTKNLTGKISYVKVTEDYERNLKVQIAFTGYENAYIRIRVLDSTKNDAKYLSKDGFSLTGKTSPVELSVSLQSAATNISFETPYIEVRVSKSESNAGGFIFYFILNKKWQSEINPENLVFTISPNPIGSATSLTNNESQIVLPRINKRYDLKKAYSVSALRLETTPATTLRAATGVRSATYASTAANSTNDVDGNWINTDADTRGITHVVISNYGTKIQTYGKCSPTDCDWGQTALTFANNNYTAVYDQAPAISTFSISISGNQLTLNDNRVYKAGGRVANNSYTFKKEAGTTSTPLILTTTPIIYKAYPLALDKTTINSGAQGPDISPISLWDDLVTDVDFESPNEITNIRMDIYPDKNKATGIYYYLPAEYHIKWDLSEGYNFKMCYSAGNTEGTSGDIRISATILPGISKKENDLIKKLLESYVNRNPGLSFKSLRMIPTAETPKVSISSELTNIYNIPSDKINVNVTSSLTDPINLSFVTDNRTKEEMQVALLENIGINGSMSIKIQNENASEQQIPVRISLEDPHTLGRFTLEPTSWRNKEWVNTTLFPLKLKYIHVLLFKDENNKSLPIIYSYDLTNVVVPSKAKVKFDAAKVPAWFDNSSKIQRIWIDYNVEKCQPCMQSIINEITCNNARRIKNISIESLSSIEKTKAAFIIIKVRSAQCDPKGENKIELSSIRIQEDAKSYQVGPFYLLESEKLNYEYFITLVMPDGVTYNSSDWIKSDAEQVYIGTHQLKQYIPDLPSIQE
jgi:hypothetical protein